MKTLQRLLINICSSDLAKSKHFYTSLFDFEVSYDSDWFVQLVSKDRQLELGIIDRENELVPDSHSSRAQGFYLTFVVDNADDVYEIAQQESFDLVSEPADTFYGQRRLLLRDPDGALVDVSSPIPNYSPGT